MHSSYLNGIFVYALRRNLDRQINAIRALRRRTWSTFLRVP